MSEDKKLRCALVYRLTEGSGAAAAPVVLTKYDHASQYESHGGAGGADETTLYGGRDQSYVQAVSAVITNDPPGGLSESGAIGGFKVVQSDQHQVVYGADADGICTFLYIVFVAECVFNTLGSVEGTVSLTPFLFSLVMFGQVWR
jgi:hypothetical protein